MGIDKGQYKNISKFLKFLSRPNMILKELTDINYFYEIKISVKVSTALGEG